ncbi:UNVERIFIED_CONTAM: hypothetical protein FKN15_035523 [Acipenser sinensis]
MVVLLRCRGYLVIQRGGQIKWLLRLSYSTIVTECRDRYFWMSIKRSFIQDRYRFDIIDNKGVHPLDGRYAASCGFTSVFNIPGDLIFRASFLACHVLNQKDTQFHLQFLFVNIDRFGRETSYPFSMTCNLGSDWKPREIVCEENYMEVSVRKNVPVIAQEGLDTEDWQGALPIAQQAAMMVWQVVIHKSGQPAKSMNISTMQALGYMVNSTSSRVYLRSPFGMPESEVLLSRVINNQYNQLYAIDLFLEHQWADDLWEVTQHRSFKPVKTPLIPETPYVINNTVPSEKGFTVTLGNFKPDVELKKLTINRVPLTLPEAQNRGVEIIKVQHPNGTNDFVLKVPFNNLLVSVEYIGGLIRRYTLNINYTLNIVPQNDPYFHPATIVCDVKDIMNNYLVYENEVMYTRALFPPSAPVITRDSEYRLTIRCRYPLNDTLTFAAERKAVPAPAPYSGNGHGYLHFRSYDPMAKAAWSLEIPTGPSSTQCWPTHLLGAPPT